MQKSGMVYLGQAYEEALDNAQKVTGAKNHPDTLRELLRAVKNDPVTRRAVRAYISDTSAKGKGRVPSTRRPKATAEVVKAGADV